MNSRGLAYASLLLAWAAYVAFLIYYANIAYPVVGHDFQYFIPRLLDAHLHYRVEGLSIQWYTPSFGGGLPAYPNPQHTQFMLAQLFLPGANPWISALAAGAIYLLAGFLSAYYFFARILKFNPLAGALGSVFFNVNGFIFTHTIVGHLGYQAFPLFPVLLIAVTHPAWPPVIKGIVISLVVFLLIHSGGFYVAVIFALSLLLLLPFTFLERFRVVSARSLAGTLGWTLLFTVPLAGSKLLAVASFMGHFPRIKEDAYQAGPIGGLFGMLLQFVGVAPVAPWLRWAGLNESSYIIFLQNLTQTVGLRIRLWEFDCGLSPALLGLLVAALFLLIRRRGRMDGRITSKRLLLLGLAGACLWLVLEFRLAQGWIYPHLQSLPILRALHVNLRFAAAFLFPLALLGTWAFAWMCADASARARSAVFALLMAVSLTAPLGYLAVRPDWFLYKFALGPALETYQGIREGQTYPIQRLAESGDSAAGGLLRLNASDLKPYEPIFGYLLEDFRAETHAGSVQDSSGGYFNMTHPAGLVYPEANGTRPFERIKVSDSVSLRLFVQHRQPAWNRPILQRVFDVLMPVSFALAILVLAVYASIGAVRRLPVSGK